MGLSAICIGNSTVSRAIWNFTSDARNRTRRSRVLFVALRVLLIPNSMANRAITC